MPAPLRPGCTGGCFALTIRRVKRISSRDNALFKTLAGVAGSARERRKSGLTLLDGPHLVEAFLDTGGMPRAVAVSESGSRRAEVQSVLARVAQPVLLPDALFGQISGVTTPVGIAALIEIPRPARDAATDCCMLLEDVQDPGNFGSILRSSAAAGVDCVFASPGCAHAWAPRVLRAAMGAHFLLTIHEHAILPEVVDRLPGRVVATRASGGRPLFQVKLTGPIALLIGNEGSGLSAPLLAAADEVVSIPMPGGAESLNVAAAAAICLFERVRQEQTMRDEG